MKPLLPKILTALMATSACLSACDDSSKTSIEEPSAFSLGFLARAGDQTVACDTTLTSLGSSAVSARLLDFRVFVQDLRFVKSDGSEIPATLDTNDWQAANVALLDFQDRDDNCTGGEKPTRTVITGSVADAEGIVGLRFRLGLPHDLNHADPAKVPAALNESSMFWTWQSGYKAMRIDLAPEGGISRPSDPDFLGTDYFFHLGSTDCVGAPERGETVACGRVNQPDISLNAYVFNASQIRIDLKALLKDLDLRSDSTESPGCMSGVSDSECGSYFQKLGLDLISGRSSGEQTVFSVE